MDFTITPELQVHDPGAMMLYGYLPGEPLILEKPGVVESFLGSFELPTAHMENLHQRLHQRHKKEGIVINYPVSTLQFPKEWGLDTMVDGGAPARP
ncbi:MAG TPA: hypothetical protein VFR55_07595 [Dehalococcoidia bacterium]|nr:hypothetical protein [Dehalococcoidia bacterium]